MPKTGLFAAIDFRHKRLMQPDDYPGEAELWEDLEEYIALLDIATALGPEDSDV